MQNHAKDEKCHKIIKQTRMPLVARREIIGGAMPIIKNRRRRPQIGGGTAGAGL